MSERWRVILPVFVIILGGFVTWWLGARPSAPEVSVDEIREQIKQLAGVVRETRVEAERKVVIIRETVQMEVDALPPDGVASGLDDELAVWRKRAVRSGGLDEH